MDLIKALSILSTSICRRRRRREEEQETLFGYVVASSKLYQSHPLMIYNYYVRTIQPRCRVLVPGYSSWSGHAVGAVGAPTPEY